MLQFSKIVMEALEAAQAAQARSYSPYSQFRVGAALKAADSARLFTGCNVENLSYGATLCAERCAIGTMVGEIGKARLEFVLVVTDTVPATVPCGICLQVLSEFCDAECPIYLANNDGIEKTMRFDQLLPTPFVDWK